MVVGHSRKMRVLWSIPSSAYVCTLTKTSMNEKRIYKRFQTNKMLASWIVSGIRLVSFRSSNVDVTIP